MFTASFRLWRASTVTNSFVGTCHASFHGCKEIRGIVLDTQDGLKVDFRNSPRTIDEAGKSTYGKPVFEPDETLEAMTASMIATFWNTSVKNVALTMDDKGKLSIAKKAQTAQGTLIEGATDFIDNAVTSPKFKQARAVAEKKATSANAIEVADVE